MSDWNLPGIEDDGDPRITMAEYVLGLTDPADRAAIERAIASNPEIAAEARFWEAQFAGLNTEYRPVTPPAGTLARIEGRLFGDQTAQKKARWYDSLVFWRAATGLAVMIALVAVSLAVLPPAGPAPQSELVAALEPVESDVSVLALYEPSDGALRLTAQGAPAGEGKDYELWLIAGEDPAISLGVIGVGQAHRVPVDAALQPLFGEGVTLAVTLEQTGGSPTGVAQGPLVSAGTATAI
ncbi:anti-sigma factor [Pelagibacterium xiamenense]|uniref:anti-sigma factor n=1 Tax=Pelagibacterium xiamenense TaxID=2901140 RepID=UPI001E2DC20A|nr:anti-sigma factor [Pelagibacterium xiamenense]MCD7058899.1 anti-sigma factor [Pelagibacterium xiamenense]